MSRLLQALRRAGILTDDLALPDDFDASEVTYRGLCKLPDNKAEGKFIPRRRRRIDILKMPWLNRGGALLYYTVCCRFQISINSQPLLTYCPSISGLQGDDIVCDLCH